MQKFKVVIVDDSRLIQSVLQELLDADERLQVVGIASDPHEARQVIKQTNPDVITLDVEMPRMNGITFLRNLMRLRPMPVVMISTLTSKGSQITLQALELGAIDFIEKPEDLANKLDAYRAEIVQKVIAAAQVSRLKLQAIQARLQGRTTQPASTMPGPAQAKPRSRVVARKVCAIGGSTGGLEALSSLLADVRFSGREAVLVCLHLPGGFTRSYAARLNSLLKLNVKEAQDGEAVMQGCVYIAPGGLHMEVERQTTQYAIRIYDAEPVSRHKPSVDVLFRSVARNIGRSAMGMILTGMGKDGAEGLLQMAGSGCQTFAQDEASSVVWGMPGTAVSLGAVTEECILPLNVMAASIEAFFVK